MASILDPEKIAQSRILVIGDVMLDRYLWGDVQRISPEAPVPIFHIRERSEAAGGAGNVVSNLVGLGCSVAVIGLCGKDETGARLSRLLANGRVRSHTIVDRDRPTIKKTRIVSNGQQLLRLDDEKIIPLSAAIQSNLLECVKNNIPDCDAVILSDYGKGILQSPGLAQSIIRLAHDRNIPVMVDPKGKDWERYEGATCVTPNIKELEMVYGDKISGKEKLAEVMQAIRNRYSLSWLLVTLGPLGMSLMGADGSHLHIPALARQVYDVSGAGDTVIASLSLGLASGLTFFDAAKLANVAAGIVVGKVGTQPITLLELRASLEINGDGVTGSFINRIASLSAAVIQVQAWKASGQKIVFTNGCFDLLHPGHIHLLNRAKNLGDRLVVGLNSDASVRRLKGPKRPILSDRDRASLLASLDAVDLVVLFEDDTPRRLISNLQPNILVKGADYTVEKVVGRDIVESYGGVVHLVPLLQGYSTTDIANKVIMANSPKTISL